MKWTFLFCFFIIGKSSFGQVHEISRFETEYKLTENNWNVISAKKDGVILFRELEKFEDGKKLWEVISLDTTLNKNWEIKIGIETRNNLIGYEYRDGSFYLLYRAGATNKSDWFLVEFEIGKGLYTSYEIENELEFELSHFIVSGGSIILGGTIYDKPTILIYSTKTGRAEIPPGSFREDSKFINIIPNINGAFNVLYLEKQKVTGNFILRLKVFSPDGDILLESDADFGNEQWVHTASTNQLRGNHLVIVGTYGKKGSKTSDGVFFINVMPGNIKTIKKIPFGNFDTVFDFMGEKRAAKLKSKVLKSSFTYKANFSIWEVEEIDDYFYISGEFYEPKYQSSNQRMGMVNPYQTGFYYPYSSRYYQNTFTPFDMTSVVEYEFEQALVAKLSLKGDLIWDDSLPIDDVDKDYLEQETNFSLYRGKAFMAYKEEGKVQYSITSPDNKTPNDSTLNVTSLNQKEEIKYEKKSEGAINNWYDNKFFVWGYQRIHSYMTNEKRYVFYVNKIEFN